MILGALLDAGVSQEALERELAKLGVDGYSLECSQSRRGGVSGTHVKVALDRAGKEKRVWRDFLDIIANSRLSPTAKDQATSIFQLLAEAEARAHRVPSSETTLHELGTLDTLIDVVGAVAGLELLGVEKSYASPMPMGSGLVRSQHGMLPAPAPATLELVSMANAPVIPPAEGRTDLGEMITPTGAAIITALASFAPQPMTMEKIGYGLGTRDSPHYPNVLALWIGERLEEGAKEGLLLLETNIDDMSPELFGYVQEQLLALGARDVWFTPIQMKKNRPGTMLSTIVPASLEAKALETVMKETSTLGIRVRPVHRREAQREVIAVATSLGPVEVKVKYLEGKAISVSPEYEVCRRIAQEKGMPLQEVYRRVTQEASDKLLDKDVAS